MRPHLLPGLRQMTAICLSVCMSAWAADWPRIALPPGVAGFEVGQQFSANGLPMRVQGFVSKDQSVSALAGWFRRSLGLPLVENSLGKKLILGRAEGGYYLNVQLEPLGPEGRGGSKGLVAVSDLAALNRNRDADAAHDQRLLDRWPAGTRLLSRMASEDNGRTSLHVVLRNGHSESLNRNALIAVMQMDGFSLVQESGMPTALPSGFAPTLRDAKAFFFKGQNKEGIATIARDEQGLTSVVLNTTAELEAYRR